jgi:hypothetical protein
MTEEIIVPEEFTKVIKDFVADIITTFPEYAPIISKWWKSPETFAYIENDADRIASIEKSERASIKLLFTFSKKKMPPRFFDILYQNEDMFKEDSEVDTEFLPHIHFKNLWQCDITKKTRDTVWKYLQLILFSIVGSLDNKEAFGDTAKLFDAINQDDFKSKLEETLARMQDLFEMSPKGEGESECEGESEGTSSNLNMEDMPKANDLHDHITGMLDGKLGKLAKEIAEETAESINMDMDNVTDMKDVLNNLIKNPAKLMGLVKNVGDKLDTKLKSGDIKESELIAEATEIMNKMKNMPGMVDIQSMLSKMGLSGLGGLGGLGGKVDVNAMEAQLNRNLKTAQTKERMKAKSEASKLAKERDAAAASNVNNAQMPTISEEEILKIFSTGEAVERTPRGTPPKKSNGKKKKGKNKLH